MELSFIHFLILFHQIKNFVGMKRLKTLVKSQESFLNTCEKIILILPLDFARIYPTSIIILVCLSEKNLERVKSCVDITDFQLNKIVITCQYEAT